MLRWKKLCADAATLCPPSDGSVSSQDDGSRRGRRGSEKRAVTPVTPVGEIPRGISASDLNTPGSSLATPPSSDSSLASAEGLVKADCTDTAVGPVAVMGGTIVIVNCNGGAPVGARDMVGNGVYDARAHQIEVSSTESTPVLKPKVDAGVILSLGQAGPFPSLCPGDSSFVETSNLSVDPGAAAHAQEPPTKKRRFIPQPSPAASSAGSPEDLASQEGMENHFRAPRLLSEPNDSHHLNALHCFVRSRIELFIATPADVAAPSPGRKNPVKPGQVGLRCIHCNSASLKAGETHSLGSNGRGCKSPKKRRVKRAVCYPSSVTRVYHSVSDMKFDHFPTCPNMPKADRDTFERLRAENSRRRVIGGNGEKRSGGTSNSSTAQYYYESAKNTGLCDVAGGGVVAGTAKPRPMKEESKEVSTPQLQVQVQGLSQAPKPIRVAGAQRRWQAPSPQGSLVLKAALPAPPSLGGIPPRQIPHAALAQHQQDQPQTKVWSHIRGVSPSPPLHLQHRSQSTPKLLPAMQQQQQQQWQPHQVPLCGNSQVLTASATVPSCPQLTPSPRFLLALPEDSSVLNPIHCFVRRNVEVFVATPADVALPSPGRKHRVRVGQVGIRCVHCAHLPPRDRVKRAVCFPPSLGGIYHSVSNMKFDHFGACRGLSPEGREEFARLKARCGRRGGGTGGVSPAGTMANSTAQYYYDSSARLGMVDSEEGIRLSPEAPLKSVRIPSPVMQQAPQRKLLYPSPTEAAQPLMQEVTHVKHPSPAQEKLVEAVVRPEGHHSTNVPSGLSALVIAATSQCN